MRTRFSLRVFTLFVFLMAGFEWGTGMYINPTPPEESARFLREAVIPAVV
jgi:galactose-1-phosphate uridylyltransferase